MIQKIKTSFISIFSGALNIYILLALFIFIPLFNYQYANENGFIDWLIFGQVVPTAKATVWPYYLIKPSFKDKYWATDDIKSDRHYTQSKKACDEAMSIIVNVGDVTKLNEKQLEEVKNLIELSLTEADLVEDKYLTKVNPDLLNQYKINYKKSLQMIVEGANQNNQAMILGGAYGYNEYADWMKSNKFNFP